MEKKYIDMWGAFFSRPVEVDSYRWNGWAVPYFVEEDLPELIKFMNEQEFTGAPWALAGDGVRGSHTDQVRRVRGTLEMGNPRRRARCFCWWRCLVLERQQRRRIGARNFRLVRT